MSKTPLKLKDMDIYKISHQLAEEVWEIVVGWKIFERDTLGKQIVRSADSVSLNICEGYGRYFYRDRRLFMYYSRGSLIETAEAIKKAYERKLITEEKYLVLEKLAKRLSVKLNNYISSLTRNIIKSRRKG